MVYNTSELHQKIIAHVKDINGFHLFIYSNNLYEQSKFKYKLHNITIFINARAGTMYEKIAHSICHKGVIKKIL